MSKKSKTTVIIDRLLQFLIWLFEQSKNEPVNLNVTRKAKEVKAPYYANIFPLLRKRGILRVLTPRDGRGSLYEWIGDKPPDRKLATLLIRACRKLSKQNDAKLRPHRTRQYTVTNTGSDSFLKSEAKKNKANEVSTIPEQSTPTPQLFEVIVVGQKRPEKKSWCIDSTVDKKSIEAKEAVRELFKFVEETHPSEEMQCRAGMLPVKYLHLRTKLIEPSYNTIQVGENVMKIHSSGGKYGHVTIFKNTRPIIFEEIVEEILAERFEIVGDINSGMIKLTEYALSGHWDECCTGFPYVVHTREKSTNKLVPLMCTRVNAEGKYESKLAISNTIRQFIFEDELQKIDALRASMIADLKPFEFKEHPDGR